MRTATALAVVVVLVLLVGGAAAIGAYDAARDDEIAQGISVADVDLGGLSRAAATAKVEAEVVAPLTTPVVAKARGERFTLTAQVARVEIDADAIVDEALRRSRRGNPVTRTWRALTDGEVESDITPGVGFSDRAVSRFVARVARNTDQRGRDADVRFTATGLERVAGRSGIKVARERLRADVERGLRSPWRDERRIAVRLKRTKAATSTSALARKYGTVVHVSRGGYRLRLYKKLKLVKTYPIAVGQVGLETPAGMYDIQNKAVNPAWNVPNSAWAGDLAGSVIPGGVPENPLKARWLGIYAGAGIHGTDARGSIGTNASHGCIRMLVEDVIDLYDRVPVGAPVYIA